MSFPRKRESRKFKLWVPDLGIRGRREGKYYTAAKGEKAEELYEYFVYKTRDMGVHTETGRFGAKMDVGLVNDGPVTMLLDNGRLF